MPEAVSASTNASASDNGVAVVDAAAEKAVLRKIDRVVLPLMCLVYFFQYLDKQAVGYAAVFNLADDLHMNSNEYSWVVSIFYLGQLTAEYLFIYLMSRLSISRLVGYMMYVKFCPYITSTSPQLMQHFYPKTSHLHNADMVMTFQNHMGRRGRLPRSSPQFQWICCCQVYTWCM